MRVHTAMAGVILCVTVSVICPTPPSAYVDIPVCHVRTPNGSTVPDTRVCEEADPLYLEYLTHQCQLLIAAKGWDAEIIGPSTRTYNCHAYAWHVSEGGDSVWIGYWTETAEDIYWEDESYLEALTDPYTATRAVASKVNYPLPGAAPGDPDRGGNHSAVTTDVPGCLISKWGTWPLVYHYWDDCPYDGSVLRAYQRNDDTAASVHGFAVAGGAARWKVTRESRTDHYGIEGAPRPDGPWEALIPFLPAGSGKREVALTLGPGAQAAVLPGDAFPYYRLVETETTGKRITHAIAAPTLVVEQNLPAPPTAQFLRQRIGELRAERAEHEGGALPTLGSGETLVAYSPVNLAGTVQFAVTDFWRDYWGYAVEHVAIDDFPHDPDSFRAHLKGDIAARAAAGARYFLLVGDANDWQWFDLEEQGAQYWVGPWLAIHSDYLASGYPPGGQPENDVIPTFAVPDTLPPWRNLGWFTPYWMTDLPYQDTDDDGSPDVVLARLPFNDQESILAFGYKMQSNQLGYFGAQSVSFFVGDLDHDGMGDGRLARGVADAAEARLPPAISARHLYESDVPSGAARNDAAAEHWNMNRPELLVLLASYSNRSWPANFFDQTNWANPWHMEMIWPQGTHAALVLGGSCDAGDFCRTEDPDYGTPIAEKFLAAWDKGAVGWIGPSVGSWQAGNGVLVRYVIHELYADPSRPSAESFLVAVQRVLADYPNRPDITNTVRSYVFLGDPLSRVNRMETCVRVPSETASPSQLVFNRSEPNPFSLSTRIAFTTTREGPVELSVFSVSGRRVRTLVNGVLPPGRHDIEWHGWNDSGERVSAGVYFLSLAAEGRTTTRKVVLAE